MAIPGKQTPEQRARARGIVGMALLASALVLVVLAALIFTGVLAVDPSSRGILAGALGAAALIDMLVGIRLFVSASST